MKREGGVILVLMGLTLVTTADAQTPALPAPHFHHLQLNSVDPDAAIAFYMKEFPSTSRTTWEGMPALSSPDNVLIVFNKVARPPQADANVTAYWHFGWNVVDSRRNMNVFHAQGILMPFYTDDQGDFVGISSDTYPYPPGVPGRTKAQLEEARSQNLQPSHQSGNGYILGPDTAVIEYTGGQSERVDHVHMWEDDPVCAQLWYETHLEGIPRGAGRGARGGNAAPPPTLATCKAPRTLDPSWPSLTRNGTYRAPTGGVSFSGVAMNWYPNQGLTPLLPTRGRLMDHIGLSVTDLDAWVAKLKAEGVTFLEQTHKLGDTRAVMIEGPSHEAIELVEVK